MQSLAMLIWSAKHGMGLSAPTTGELKLALAAIDKGTALVDPVDFLVSDLKTGKAFF